MFSLLHDVVLFFFLAVTFELLFLVKDCIWYTPFFFRCSCLIPKDNKHVALLEAVKECKVQNMTIIYHSWIRMLVCALFILKSLLIHFNLKKKKMNDIFWLEKYGKWHVLCLKRGIIHSVYNPKDNRRNDSSIKNAPPFLLI